MSKARDAKLLDLLYDELVVKGVKRLRVRRNDEVDTPCDSCDKPIQVGYRFVRVVYEDERGREHFHIRCFRWEFTNGRKAG